MARNIAPRRTPSRSASAEMGGGCKGSSAFGRPPGSAPAAAIGSIEDVHADAADLHHLRCPSRANIDGMIMRGGSDFGKPDLAGGHGHHHLAGDLPVIGRIHLVLDLVAGEGKLAGIRPVLVLVDDAADRLRICRVSHTVEYDLGDCRLPLD